MTTSRTSFMKVVFAATLAAACVVLGGFESIDDDTPVPAVGAEGGPSRPLNALELAIWKAGRRVFDRDFHSTDGLGRPDFNGDSCRACHSLPAIGGAQDVDLNVSRFALDNLGAGPYQELPGGQIASRLRRPLGFAGGREDIPANADVYEQRNSPSLFGFGFIDSIPESEIISHEDPNDLNADGIRGVARRLTVAGQTEIGRFGWKCQVPSLSDFIRDAMGEELGITVVPDNRGFGITTDNDNVPDPELTPGDFQDALFFLSNLAAPPRGGGTGPLLAQGEALFTSLGCATCHIPSLQGSGGPVPLFSNLLLHNVQAPGFRGMSEPGADVGFYRTPPLWGISKTGPYLHDGRAETLRAAILSHFGEALSVRNNFVALSANDEAALIFFLQDL